MSNPYQTLDVANDAPIEDIRQAFRRKVMEHHPDRQGDMNKFDEVKRAYNVLSHDGKRAEFDKTGQMPEDKPDNAQVQIVGLLANVFLNVASQVAAQTDKPEYEDMAAHMRTFLAKFLEKITEDIAEIKKTHTFLSRCLGRFRVTKTRRKPKTVGVVLENADFLENAIKQQLNTSDMRLKNAQTAYNQHNAALDLMKALSFDHVKRMMGQQMFGMQTNTSTQ